jgi:phosphopantetheinyl transferase
LSWSSSSFFALKSSLSKALAFLPTSWQFGRRDKTKPLPPRRRWPFNLR